MKCPSCEASEPLSLTSLRGGLTAYGCQSCQGSLVDIEVLRHWCDTKPSPEAPEVCSLEVRDTQQALTCPKCARFMRKCHLSDSFDNQVDVCRGCQQLWLDEGEWDLILSHQLQSSLPDVLQETSQRLIRRNVFQHSIEAKYRGIFGDDYESIREFVEWMMRHDRASEIEHYIARVRDRERDRA